MGPIGPISCDRPYGFDGIDHDRPYGAYGIDFDDVSKPLGTTPFDSSSMVTRAMRTPPIEQSNNPNNRTIAQRILNEDGKAPLTDRLRKIVLTDRVLG